MHKSRIAIILVDRFADWEPALLTCGARDYFNCEIVSFAPGGNDTLSAGGLRIRADGDLASLDPSAFDLLCLPGSEAWQAADALDVGKLLRAAVGTGRTVAAICDATVAAARAGLLDERAHTSNSLEFLQQHAPAYQGARHYIDTPRAVSDRGVVTAPGLAPASFATSVFRVLWADREREIAAFERMCAREHLPLLGGIGGDPDRDGKPPGPQILH